MDRLKTKLLTVYTSYTHQRHPKISVLSALVEGSLLFKFSITWLRNISFFKTKGCGQAKPSLISSSCSLERGSVSELVLKNTRSYHYY